MKKSTNKWAIERARESANALLRKSGTEPLLVEVLSSLLWVVDHQQDQLEQMYVWTKYTIEQALVDHACGDGTVQINETCHEAIKAYWHTDDIAHAREDIPAPVAEVEPLRIAQTQSYYQILEQRLAAQGAALRKALEIAQAVADAGVADGDEYGSGSWLMFSGYDAETVRQQARALLARPSSDTPAEGGAEC